MYSQQEQFSSTETLQTFFRFLLLIELIELKYTLYAYNLVSKELQGAHTKNVMKKLLSVRPAKNKDREFM